MKKGISESFINKFTKKLLEKEYVENKKSFRELNKQLGINERTVRKLLDHYKIPIRYGTEAIKSQWEGTKGNNRREIRRDNRKYRVVTNDGYFAVLYKGEHKSLDRGRVKEHILIMEDKLGRRLREGEVVHHKDGNKLNNLPSNLIVMNKGEHNKLHRNEMKKDTKGVILGKVLK